MRGCELGAAKPNLNSFPFAGHVSFAGNVVWFTTDWFEYSGSNTIVAQHGDFYGVDFTNPAQPTPNAILSANSVQPASSNLSPWFSSISDGSSTVYILSTTSTGGNTNGWQGALEITDVSDPQSPQAIGEMLIPQATALTPRAVQRNLMLVSGNTKSCRNLGVNPRNNALNFQASIRRLAERLGLGVDTVVRRCRRVPKVRSGCMEQGLHICRAGFPLSARAGVLVGDYSAK
jgi:hypothetical protein